MRRSSAPALLGAALLLTACADAGPGNAALDTDDQKASYGIGLDVGRNLEPTETRLDRAAFLKGLEDGMSGADPAIAEEELQTVLQAFSEAVMAERQKEQDEIGVKNQADGAAYLAENGAKEGVTTTASGVQYEVLRAGDGPMPTPESMVTVHYKGTLIDGTQFDSSYDRGEPATFSAGGLIPGFTEALLMMPVGSHWRIVIPGDQAYGPTGAGADIGPNATLIFEIELIEIGG